MNNQTAKVIKSAKSKFSTAVPAIIAIVILGLVFLVGQIILKSLMNEIDKHIAEYSEIGLKSAIELLLAGSSLEDIFASSGDDAFMVAFLYITKIVCIFSNVFTSIGMLLISIGIILMMIGVIVSHATLTEAGIYGRNNDMRKFDLTFDRITEITHVKNAITIKYLNEKGKKKKCNVYVDQAKDFAAACNNQLKQYKLSASNSTKSE